MIRLSLAQGILNVCNWPTPALLVTEFRVKTIVYHHKAEPLESLASVFRTHPNGDEWPIHRLHRPVFLNRGAVVELLVVTGGMAINIQPP